MVYRLIFLAVSEDRDLLHGPDASAASRELYASAYGFSHLRERSARRSAHDHHHDAWEGAKIVFRGLQRGEKVLGLPPLGGLFAQGRTPDLDDTRLPNKAFLRAVFHMSWLIEDGRRVRINWRDMATEELGSVYEGLLNLSPLAKITADASASPAAQRPAETREDLAEAIIRPIAWCRHFSTQRSSRCSPGREAEGGADAILKLSVIDPACGSGHFLLGAARRMASRIAFCATARPLIIRSDARCRTSLHPRR